MFFRQSKLNSPCTKNPPPKKSLFLRSGHSRHTLNSVPEHMHSRHTLKSWTIGVWKNRAFFFRIFVLSWNFLLQLHFLFLNDSLSIFSHLHFSLLHFLSISNCSCKLNHPLSLSLSIFPSPFTPLPLPFPTCQHLILSLFILLPQSSNLNCYAFKN